MASNAASMATDNDDDMYLFTGDAGQTPSSFTGQAFDSFLDATTAQMADTPGTNFLDPGSLVVKKEESSAGNAAVYGRDSTSSSSTSSSSDSPLHNRNISTATTTSPTMSKHEMWDTGINGMSMPMNEQYFDPSNMSMGEDQDVDLDQQMASAFDFDTAASTPSGFDSATMNGGRMYASQPQIRRNPNLMGMHRSRHTSPRVTAAPASFFLGSREASPLNSMLPTSQAPSPWTKHSPSSGLEETFNHMGMNGDSPGNATFSPTMHMNYGDAQFTFPHDSSGTPSSFAKDVSSPPSTIQSTHSVRSMDGHPTLRIHPTSLKSRVETQIPIKMTMYPLPQGVRKLRLPTHTVSKPKFLAKPEQEMTSEILDLHVSLVCTSAMQDPIRKQRALARARGEELAPYSRPSPASSTGSASSKEDEEKPLNGGEVRICPGCIQRERKRASRKKQKKPEEEELFQKDEEKRVVVFNTNEIKEWIEVTRETLPPNEQANPPPPGTMQVELPMRIACYCRHQNEKLGFMVIFTIKDSRNKVVAQAMTNSIMITDDHKTHNAPQPVPTAPAGQLPQATHFPGSAVFNTDLSGNETAGNKLFKQSYSTPDLTRLQQGFNGQFTGMNAAPFVIPQALSGTTSGTLTPRNLSRPASPSGPAGPATKRRKPSGSGKLPSGLTMTRIETAPTQSSGAATMPNTAASSPYAPSMPNFMAGTNPQAYPSTVSARNFNSPPTPGGDGTFGAINRSFSLENLPRQALLSAPSSRQASRPGSPLASARNSFGQNDGTFPQALNQQLMAHTQRRPHPVIHKLVPNEGSVSGGTEVTLLGNGFYQGLEVMFGDTEATTTTFWGEKCLNCIAPPAVAAGMVSVVFKHEHPMYATTPSPAQVRQTIYTYVDDREIEMLKLALRTIGQRMGTDDPYAAAQQLLQQNQPGNGPMFPQQGYPGMANGHQRSASGMGAQAFGKQELERCLLRLLRLSLRQHGSSKLHLDLRRPTGMTLLHFAASYGMFAFTNALLTAGADPDVLDNNGFGPMHHAAMNGHDEAVNQLRSAGADHRLRSIRNFVPADLATTLRSYQATMRPYQHSRSKSTGTTSSRNESSMSVSSFWDQPATTESESESFDEDRAISLQPKPSQLLPYAQPLPSSAQPSRRSSQHELSQSLALVKSQQPFVDAPPSSAFTNAWRQLVNLTQGQQAQLIGQLQHLQDNIPALPQLPQIDNGMMRRMSLLFPRSTSPDDDGKVAPPSYNELFPSTSNVSDDKKDVAGVMQAAAEASVDQHFESASASARSVKLVADQKLDSRSITQDRRLFFFWIPLLLILVGLMVPNSPISNIVNAVVERYIAP